MKPFLPINKSFSPIRVGRGALFIGLFASVAGAVEEVPERLTLEDAWRIAEERNETLRIQREERFKASNLKWKAAALVLPQISADASWTAINSESEATFIVGETDQGGGEPSEGGEEAGGQFSTISYTDNFTTKSIGVTLTQPLFQGEAWPLYQQADANLESQLAEEDELLGSTRLEVARAYIGALKAQGALETAKRQVERLAEHLRLAETLLEVGRGIETDKLQAEVALQAARTQERAAANGVAIALEGLYMSMGQRGAFALVDPQENDSPLPALEEGLALAKERRGSLVSAQRMVDASEQKHNQTIASFLPSAYFIGAFSHSENDALFGQKSDRWSATFNVSVPIFEGGLRIANLREDSAGIRQAESALRLAQNGVELEVRTAYLNMETAKDLLVSTQTEIRLAEAQHRLVSARYRQGRGTSLDVKDAQTALFEAEIKGMLRRYERLESRLAYLQSIGELAKLEPTDR